MRFFDSDAYCTDVEYRLIKLQDMVTPEQMKPVSTLFYDAEGDPGYTTNWGLFPFESASYVWAKGSINGVDVGKIKILKAIEKYNQQEHLDLAFELDALLLRDGGIVFTGGTSNTLAADITAQNSNFFTLTVNIPDGWDGRNSFIKMSQYRKNYSSDPTSDDFNALWTPGNNSANRGPLALISRISFVKKDIAMGWTIEKTSRQLIITYQFDLSTIFSALGGEQIDTQFTPLYIKLWRSSNVSRR